MSNSIKLSYNSKEYEFPLIEGSEKEKAIDIKTLRAQTGLITYDPGYKNTGSCKVKLHTLMVKKESCIIVDIQLKSYAQRRACEVAFLLIFGDMPTKKELGLLNDEIRKDSLVDEDIKLILKSFLSLHILWAY